jgi:hypothetical protein
MVYTMALLAALALAACSPSSVPGEEQSLRLSVAEYNQALVEQQYARAFAMLSSGAQDRAQGRESYVKQVRKYGILFRSSQVLSATLVGNEGTVRVRSRLWDPYDQSSATYTTDQTWIKERGVWRLDKTTLVSEKDDLARGPGGFP